MFFSHLPLFRILRQRRIANPTTQNFARLAKT
jgi:hypothetical protein